MINSLKSTKACNQDRTIIKNNGLSKRKIVLWQGNRKNDFNITSFLKK